MIDVELDVCVIASFRVAAVNQFGSYGYSNSTTRNGKLKVTKNMQRKQFINWRSDYLLDSCVP